MAIEIDFVKTGWSTPSVVFIIPGGAAVTGAEQAAEAVMPTKFTMQNVKLRVHVLDAVGGEDIKFRARRNLSDAGISETIPGGNPVPITIAVPGSASYVTGDTWTFALDLPPVAAARTLQMTVSYELKPA